MSTPRPIRRIAVSAGYAPSLILFRGPLLDALRKAGLEVLTMAPEGGESVRSALSARGVSFFAVHLRRASVSPGQDLAYAWNVFRLLRRTRPDAYFGYTIKPVLFGTLAACLARVPRRFAMITGLGFTFQKDDWLGRVVRILYRVALARCHRVFFQNTDDAEEFTRRGLVHPDRVALTNGSGVDLEHYSFSECPAGSLRFLLIGRLLRSKGIGEYLAAAAAVRAEHPDARFGLVGGCDPNPDSYLPADVEAWGRAGVVEYHPQTADVRPFLETCTVYVLPSYREGTPRTVLEAMATGRAVITTDAPGCRETIRNPRPAEDAPPGVLVGDNGFLIPPRDTSALRWAMNRFIAHPDLAARMGAAGRRYAEDRYEAGRVASDMLTAMGIA